MVTLDFKEQNLHVDTRLLLLLIIIIIIIIKKTSAVQGWERVIYTLSVRRPQPHNITL